MAIVALLPFALISHFHIGAHGAFIIAPSTSASSCGISSPPSISIKSKCYATEHCRRGRNQYQSHRSIKQSISIRNSMVLHPRMDDTSISSLPPSLHRRQLLQLQTAAYLNFLQPLIPPTKAIAFEETSLPRGRVFEIDDPETFSAVAYIPPARKNNGNMQKLESYPVLVVLHGAGINSHSAMYEFTQTGSPSTPPGDHTNLPPYLLSTLQAPSSLSENFVVVAPYAGKGKRSLYDESRGKILSFLKWFTTWIESQTLEGATTSIAINRKRISLFGFSEGSTLAIEMATTRQFNGVVVCSYGFTGILPKIAVQRLQGIPIWIFHSKGDDVYDIRCSNQLVESLMAYEGGLDVFSVGNILKFTKLIPQQSESSSSREHVRAALVASKNDEVFTWLLSQGDAVA